MSRQLYTTKQLILKEVELTCTMTYGRSIASIVEGLTHVNLQDGQKAVAQLVEDKKITLRGDKLYKRR